MELSIKDWSKKLDYYGSLPVDPHIIVCKSSIICGITLRLEVLFIPHTFLVDRCYFQGDLCFLSRASSSMMAHHSHQVSYEKSSLYCTTLKNILHKNSATLCDFHEPWQKDLSIFNDYAHLLSRHPSIMLPFYALKEACKIYVMRGKSSKNL